MVRCAEVIRTCVGCRQRATVTELLRVVAGSDSGSTGFQLVPDPARRLPGRGSHIHLDPGCLAQAVRRRAFGRALRLDSSPDVAPLEEYVIDRTRAAARYIDGGDTSVRSRQQGR